MRYPWSPLRSRSAIAVATTILDATEQGLVGAWRVASDSSPEGVQPQLH
jgi:hypothetical protein